MGYLWARIIALAPARLRPHLGRILLGWKVHPTAHIGRSVIQVRHLTMGPGTRIGPSNVIRALEELRLEEGAQIGSLNRIIGFPLDIDAFPRSPDRRPALILHPYSAVMRANEIDCSDRVELGEHAVLAGYGSTILTHSYNLVTDQPTA